MLNFPLVYVLILNYNGGEVVAECVDSVLKSDYPNFQVLVVDNASKDGSVQRLRERFNNRIHIIENQTNLGYSCGFNVGLEYGFVKNNAKYSLVMNCDTIINREGVLELVKAAEGNAKAGFIIGKVYYYDKPNVFQTVGKVWGAERYFLEHIGNNEIDRGQYDTIAEREFVDDIFWLVTRDVYEDVGGYSPIFFLECEDLEWQLRAKEKKYKIIYTPYAKIWHRESFILGKNSTQKIYFDARNAMIAIMLHKPPGFFKRYFWHDFGNILWISLQLIRHFRFYAAFRNVQGFISGILWGLKNKKLTIRHFV